MSSGAPLDIRLTRRVHAGLRLDVAITLGAECGVVFGPSGAGKTSLLRMIAGLDRPDTGHVRLGETALFDGATRIDPPLRHRRIGMIFQDDLLFPHLDVAANVRFGLGGWTRAEAERRTAEVAGLCGIGQLLDRRPETLSGGERQRVGLARALAPRPRLLLCDEPVSALDIEARFELVERLKQVQRAESIPMIYVTHNPAEAVALGSRLFLLRDGRIAAEGSPLDVLAEAGSVLGELRNTLPARVEGHASEGGATFLRLDGGPTLVVPSCDRPAGSALSVAVRADDILIARGPTPGLSARNVLAGVVDRLVPHGSDVEVLVRTGGVSWIVSLVAPAVSALELRPGVEVHLVIKARSCRVIDVA